MSRKKLTDEEREARWEARKERMRAYNRARRLANPEWYEKEKAGILAYQKAHPEKKKARNAAWYRANTEKAKASRRTWEKANPDKMRAIRAARRACVSSGEFTAEEWAESKDRTGHCCFYCGAETKLTVDHVIPLSRGGLHHKSNIVPACKSCNSRKRTRDQKEFMATLRVALP